MKQTQITTDEGTISSFTMVQSSKGIEIAGPETDRREFLRQLEIEIKAELEAKGIPLQHLNFVFFRITLPCGCYRAYATADDVPLVDVACAHGILMLTWKPSC